MTAQPGPGWLHMWLKIANLALAASLLLWLPVLFAAGLTLSEYEGGHPGAEDRGAHLFLSVIATYPLWTGFLLAVAWWRYQRGHLDSAVAVAALLTGAILGCVVLFRLAVLPS